MKTEALRASNDKASRRSRVIHGESQPQQRANPVHPLLRLQQSIGNQAVARLIQARLLRCKAISSSKTTLQRQPASDSGEIQSYVFGSDKRLANDKTFARQSGEEIAVRMLASGSLTPELRAELNGMLAFFQGDAKDDYIKEIRPALLQITSHPANEAERNDPTKLQGYTFAGDKRLATDKNFARRSGAEVAGRIRASGEISWETRLEMQGMLAFFQGDAKEEYSKQIKPALVPRQSGDRPHLQVAIDCPIGQTVLNYEDKTGRERCITEDDPEFRENYIDNNIVLATGLALPGTTWENIDASRVPEMKLTYKDGRILVLDVKDIPLEASRRGPKRSHTRAIRPLARYERRFDGFIYPIRSGTADYVSFTDASNIMSLRAGLDENINELQRQFKLIEAGATFAGMVAALGGIAAMNKHFGKGGLFEEIPKKNKPQSASSITDEPAPSQTTKPVNTGAVSQLTAEMQGLLKAGGVKKIAVEGVEFASVQVSKQGKTLAVSRYSTQRVNAPGGHGRVMTQAFEDAAVQVARNNGLKKVTINVGRITNPGWRAHLESHGYVRTQTETGGGGYSIDWIKTIKL